MKYLHTMVRVSNLEQSLDFYCNKLGLIEVKRTENAKGRFTLVFLAAPADIEQVQTSYGPMLELTYNWDRRITLRGRNFGHLAYHVDDIYKICQHLQECGVVINRPPRDGHMALFVLLIIFLSSYCRRASLCQSRSLGYLHPILDIGNLIIAFW